MYKVSILSYSDEKDPSEGFDVEINEMIRDIVKEEEGYGNEIEIIDVKLLPHKDWFYAIISYKTNR